MTKKFMTTKEIVFDSKNLPVNIDEVEWLLRGDYEKEIKEIYKLLNDSEVRFRAITNNLACIGTEKLHADFNCMHCLAQYGAKKIVTGPKPE